MVGNLPGPGFAHPKDDAVFAMGRDTCVDHRPGFRSILTDDVAISRLLGQCSVSSSGGIAPEFTLFTRTSPASSFSLAMGTVPTVTVRPVVVSNISQVLGPSLRMS